MLKKLIAAFFIFYTAWSLAAVDINKASQADLQGVKGIGPATATRIMDARKQGPFKSWDDVIARVKGIGPNSASKLSNEGLTVNGQAYKASNKPASASSSASEKLAKPSQTANKK